MDSISNGIKKTYNDFVSGQCFDNFNCMTTETKIITILKTVAIALAAGIISGALIGLASPVAGVLVGFTIAAVVGLTSFACFTSAYDPVECLKDHTNKCLSKIKQKVNEFIH